MQQTRFKDQNLFQCISSTVGLEALWRENPSPPTSLDRDAFTARKLEADRSSDSRSPLDVTVG